MNNNREKICFVSSSGGHFEQLMRLYPLMSKNDSYIITEQTDYSPNCKDIKSYFIKQVNRRELLFIPKMITNSFVSFKILVSEKPSIIISTGVLSTLPTCIFARLFGAKIVYIESFAKISTPTITGKLMYKFADRFYVQWESMLEVYPDAVFLGGIY